MCQLPDGELLALGGGNERNPERSKTSETMNPATMQWTQAGDLAIGNEVSPIVLLYSGEVLMTHRPPQLYNPGTRKWRLAGDFAQANRMANGEVCTTWWLTATSRASPDRRSAACTARSSGTANSLL